MRNAPTVAALVLLLSQFCIAGTAHTQGPTQPPATVSPKVNLSLEQRHVIREIIKDTGPESATTNIRATVGDEIPTEVKLQPMPSQVVQKVPQIKAHEFFVADGQIFIVDPKDHKVADVIKLATD